MWNCRVIIQLSVMVTWRSAHQIELKTKYLSCIWAHFSGGKLIRNEIFVMYLSWLFWRQFVSHWRICRFAPSKQFTQTLMAILMLSNVMLIFLINKGKCASNLQNIVRSLLFLSFLDRTWRSVICWSSWAHPWLFNRLLPSQAGTINTILFDRFKQSWGSNQYRKECFLTFVYDLKIRILQLPPFHWSNRCQWYPHRSTQIASPCCW